MINRRLMLKYLTASLLYPGMGNTADRQPIRIGITPVFQTERTSLLRDWRLYLEEHMGQPVYFEQSNTYRDIINNLLAQRLDFAWICGLPYINHQSRLVLTAVPLYQGKPLYRSYLIVPGNDTSTSRLTDLRGRVFAYADPDSNSGFLVPNYQLAIQGLEPDSFFRKTFFTNGHGNAIEAVSVGLADGAHVDGYIWESMQRISPAITQATRVVSRSQEFAFPPLVAGPTVSTELNRKMHKVLLNMGADPNAVTLLDGLNLDGFTHADPSAYQDIAEMAKILGEFRLVP